MWVGEPAEIALITNAAGMITIELMINGNRIILADVNVFFQERFRFRVSTISCANKARIADDQNKSKYGGEDISSSKELIVIPPVVMSNPFFFNLYSKKTMVKSKMIAAI
jgi:hypothetical protein